MIEIHALVYAQQALFQTQFHSYVLHVLQEQCKQQKIVNEFVNNVLLEQYHNKMQQLVIIVLKGNM